MTVFHFNEDDEDDDTTTDIPRAPAAPRRERHGPYRADLEAPDAFEMEYVSVMLARAAAERDRGNH